MAKSKSTIGQYNATISAIRKSTGVSRKEAQQAYRGAQVRMGRAPTAKDVRSRAVQQEARTAGAKIAAARQREEAEREARIARARLTGAERRALKARDKVPIAAGPPRGRRKPGEAEKAKERPIEEKQDRIGAGPPRSFGGEKRESPKKGRKR
jgi:hypothetical protein